MTEEELEEKSKEYALNKWEGQCPWGAIQQGYKDGYLEGLHEVQPKWHKVADGDLPKKEGEYLICYQTDAGYKNTFSLKWATNGGKYHWYDDAYETYDEGVIAWCEIPQFKDIEL